MLGVPASNLYGSSLYSVFSNVTDEIMSPPPWYGGIASRAVGRPDQAAAPGRPLTLWPGKRVEVAADGTDVHRHMRDGLGAIDEHGGPGGFRRRDQRADRINRAE